LPTVITEKTQCRQAEIINNQHRKTTYSNRWSNFASKAQLSLWKSAAAINSMQVDTPNTY